MIPKRLVALVLDRDNHTCVIAGPGCLGIATVADHRANRGMGGGKSLDDPRNLIAACGICNGLKEDADGETRLWLLGLGLRVEKAATNQATLVRCAYQFVEYPDGSQWFLTSDGRRVDEQSVPF
jgi:5-methylcytosine-specific restriction endonuclease McrA